MLSLMIPTYRPSKVVETVRAYDNHFHKFGHTVPIVVFDDSPGDQAARNLEERLGLVHNPVYVVGETEKCRLLSQLTGKVVRSARDRAVVERMLAPSFGGNRNHILLYSLGERFIAVDDDIRPYGLVSNDFNEGIGDESVVILGRPVWLDSTNHYRIETDIIGTFDNVLGRRVSDIRGYQLGQHVWDPKSDLYKNKSLTLAADRSLFHIESPAAEFNSAVIKMAETGLSGTDDLDTLDFLYFFIKDPRREDAAETGKVYVLAEYHPFISKDNWKTACGVSGYDNSDGLPAFFPTGLRFEDYAYRLWIQKTGIASCHVNAMQHHDRDVQERPKPWKDILNEEFANFLKDRLRESLESIEDVKLVFSYDGVIRPGDVDEIMHMGRKTHDDLFVAQKNSVSGSRRSDNLERIAHELKREFCNFDSSRLYRRMSATINDEVSMIKDSQDVWPSCLEFAHSLKKDGLLPIRRVNFPGSLAFRPESSMISQHP